MQTGIFVLCVCVCVRWRVVFVKNYLLYLWLRMFLSEVFLAQPFQEYFLITQNVQIVYQKKTKTLYVIIEEHCNFPSINNDQLFRRPCNVTLLSTVEACALFLNTTACRMQMVSRVLSSPLCVSQFEVRRNNRYCFGGDMFLCVGV